MLFDVSDRFVDDFPVGFGVFGVARLQVSFCRFDVCVGAHVLMCALIHDFEFVDLPVYDGLLFGGAGDPVDAIGQRYGSVGFHLYEIAVFVELVDERCGQLQGRFAAGDDEVSARIAGDAVQYRFRIDFVVRPVFRVAKGTGEVTAREPDKNGRCAGETAFALYRIENFVYFHRLSSSSFR